MRPNSGMINRAIAGCENIRFFELGHSNNVVGT